MPKCRVCKKNYTCDNEVGYSRDLCGPYCDGIERGKKMAATRCKEISRQRYLAENQAVEIDKKISEEFDV